VPVVEGIPALDAIADMLNQLRKGNVDRSRLGEEFNAFLTPDRVRAASVSLRRLGRPKKMDLTRTRERGGMEVSVVNLKLGRQEARAVMYRTPDGKIQEFLVGPR
jgi:hypothetical protein